MGSSQSIPSTLSREKVFELTRSTRHVMDILLNYMLKEVTVRDFLALSNPSECKKYVLFMANNLYKHFYELQIVPTKDKKGVIAFRPVKDLVTPPQELQNERQSLCLTIAYFYTRIFQIYGALALTLVDDSTYMTESGIISLGDTTQTQTQTQTQHLLPPGYIPYTMSGGNISSVALGNFNFLRTYLYDDKNTIKGYLTRYAGEDYSRGVIYFDRQRQQQQIDAYGRLYDIDVMSEISLQTGIFSIGYKGAKKYATLEIFAKLEGIGGVLKVQFGKLKYSKLDSLDIQVRELGNDIHQKTIIIEAQRPSPTSSYIYTIKGSELSISDYFDNIFNKLVPYLKQVVEGDTATTTTVAIQSESGTADELRLGRIIQNLTKTKPLGHCLARALQLLKTMPLNDNKDGVSSICKSKFLEQTRDKTVLSRSGLPQPGASLDTSPGLAALAQLFYDTVLIGTPKIVIGQKPGPDGRPSSLQQYIVFMKKMAILFGDNTDTSGPRSNAYFQEQGLKGIKNKRDAQACKTIKDNISVPSSVTGNVYDVVNKLYKIQVEHASKCGNLFKLLFNIQQDKETNRFRISFSNNIIAKGFPEIERINFLARDVLIQYYSTCENTYLYGMKIVLDNTPEARVRAMAAKAAETIITKAKANAEAAVKARTNARATAIQQPKTTKTAK